MILKLGQKCCSYSTFMPVNTIIVNASIITFDNEPSRSGTRRLVTKKKWSSASRSGTGDDLICLHSTFELYHQKKGDACRYHDPGPTSLRKNVETPSDFHTSFFEAMLGELGRLSCLDTRHVSFSSTFRRDPPRRIYRLADSPRRDFGKPCWMVLCPQCRGSDDNCSPSALTYHLSLSLPPVNALLSLSVLSHTPLL